MYSRNHDAEQLLRQSFADVLRVRQAELADRLVDINSDAAIAELLPLAENYLTSRVFERVEKARESAGGNFSKQPTGRVGLWSEVPFRLRRPLGILTGAIDKLLVIPAGDGKGFEIEIIDFKTNRMRSTGDRASIQALSSRTQNVEADSASGEATERPATRTQSRHQIDQFAFDFEQSKQVEPEAVAPTSLAAQVLNAASDYQLQMQAYALALNDLMPSLAATGLIKVTLHFLDPNIEFQLAPELLSRDACARAIDAAMMDIVTSHEPLEFPVRPALHCRMCSFLGICAAGREWVGSAKAAKSVAVPFRSIAVKR